MSMDTLVRIKNEALEHSVDPFLFHNYSAFADLSNRRIGNNFKCFECNDQADYECPSCICQVCLYQTNPEKRYCCFLCQKVFHDSCRNNPELASSTGRWLCYECKRRENKHLSTFKPLITEVISQVVDVKPQMIVIKSEEYDCNANAAYSTTFSQSMKISPNLDSSLFLDTKEKIVESVAKSFMRKMNNACRNKICVVVPSNHFGPIPGISVGTCWKYRLQVSESGVHRPLVAGIHGRENEGAYSIVLSGVYAEDQDYGNEFFYSGCGGRDRDPHKRLSVQTQDQTLTRYNKALAVSCNAPFNDQIGAEASEWRAGKPVRVIRNYKLSKHSVFAPKEGNRYDGIYKVVKYFPTIGKSGLLVWRYLLRRDDPEPAPWTKEGQRIIEEKDLRVIWPYESENEDTADNYEKITLSPQKRSYDYSGPQFRNTNQFKIMRVESGSSLPTTAMNSVQCETVEVKPDINQLQMNLLQEQDTERRHMRPSDESLATNDKPAEEPTPTLNITVTSVMSIKNLHNSHNDSTSCKTKHTVDEIIAINDDSNPDTTETLKNGNLIDMFRIKKEEIPELPSKVEKYIELDKFNKNLWEYCKTYLSGGEAEFLNIVRLMFTCRYCCKLVDCPITTPCDHNVCLECITNHFSKKLFSCPECHYYLGPSFRIKENKNLADALEYLFPAYNFKVSRLM